MSGRRWKEAIHDSAASTILSDSSSPDPIVVIGGPANSYTHYIATPEEYGIQRYEGASTLYGPYTLNAYINLTLSHLPFLSPTSVSQPPPGPLPPNNVNKSLSFITGVVYDGHPLFTSYGDIKNDVSPSYPLSSSPVITATFIGANPRNNLHLESTYASIEMFIPETSKWNRVRDDSDWSLIFEWKKVSEILGTSEVTITWETEEWAQQGRYRIRYFGDSKVVGGAITPFEGVSAVFELV